MTWLMPSNSSVRTARACIREYFIIQNIQSTDWMNDGNAARTLESTDIFAIFYVNFSISSSNIFALKFLYGIGSVSSADSSYWQRVNRRVNPMTNEKNFKMPRDTSGCIRNGKSIILLDCRSNDRRENEKKTVQFACERYEYGTRIQSSI